MSLVSALYAGMSGIQAFSGNMQAIGNNIANVNTIGYKSSSMQFADLINQSGGNLLSQIGRGVRAQSMRTLFSQGAFQNTNRVTDLAVDGAGFFILSDGNTNSYTRTGTFNINQEGFLTSPDGLFVQGYTFDQAGQRTQSLDQINLSNLVPTPNPTGDGTTAGSGIQLQVNLDASEEVLVDGGGTPIAFDVTNPVTTSNFFTTTRVYDSLGNDHTLTIYFHKTADNTWDWHALADGADITGGTAGVDQEVADGTISFTEGGALDTEVVNNNTLNFTGGAAQGQVIGFDFGDSITTEGGTGLSGSTQFSSPSIVNFLLQDGFGSGSLRGIAISNDGTISGVFSNGQTRQIAQLALATFQNEEGLLKISGNLWAESAESGAASITSPTTGSAGQILSQSLELSNVDLANEFVQLITNQRAMQASARMLTTSDEMLNEIVNLKR